MTNEILRVLPLAKELSFPEFISRIIKYQPSVSDHMELIECLCEIVSFLHGTHEIIYEELYQEHMKDEFENFVKFI